EHIARIAVRNPELVPIGRHYGTVVRTCLPADPQSKGGSEATVRIAKRDLVPTQENLREGSQTFAEVEQACVAFMAEVNARPQRGTRAARVRRLARDRLRVHPVPDAADTAAFGQTRGVSHARAVSVGSVRCSVPHTLGDTTVWVRFHGDD